MLFFLFLFATFVNATPITSNVKVIYYSFPAGQQAKADELISKYQTISMCLNVAVASKGLLLNFNENCSKYKQLFDEANTSLATNLPSDKYDDLKLLRDKINSDPNQFAEFIDNTGNITTSAGRFIAKTAAQLRIHLNSIVNKPLGKSYNNKDLYRSLSINSETAYGALPKQMTDYFIYSNWGRYDADGAENAMYLSKTIIGNQTELVPHYGTWSSFSTYKFSNVQLDNLLDLTDDVIREQLATEFSQLVKISNSKSEMYEFTNELAIWARQQGYNGLIVPGARGTKNYENIVLFNQTYIDQVLQGKLAEKILKQ
ncbi:MAG: hypothetical protein ACK504_08595 [Bacteroidota bacterium]